MGLSLHTVRHSMRAKWPLLQSQTTQCLPVSPTLIPPREWTTGSGCVQPVVPSAGAISVRQRHRAQYDRSKESPI